MYPNSTPSDDVLVISFSIDCSLGYGYSGCDAVAIARLRGSGLKELLIPEDCLEADESHELANEEDIDNIAEVSKQNYCTVYCNLERTLDYFLRYFFFGVTISAGASLDEEVIFKIPLLWTDILQQYPVQQ